MIHQGLTNLKRVSHAGTIHLGIDVTHQVGLEIDVLDQRQRVIRLRLIGMPAEHLDGIVATKLSAEVR
ncbi:hypothetical protein SDC9_130916 [bioreactor metagenome]|uniref:Uncharacterized protein n=1 Tax=bioreactor metagenome TaxID=1076179 RepID=A0A645D3V9_9ZZZZ